MKKALTAIVAAGALVTVVAQATEAGIDRTLPTKHAKVKIGKTAQTTKQTSRRAARPGSIVVSSAVLCPEQELGDSSGYCVIVSSASSPPAVAHYNDGEGT